MHIDLIKAKLYDELVQLDPDEFIEWGELHQRVNDPQIDKMRVYTALCSDDDIQIYRPHNTDDLLFRFSHPAPRERAAVAPLAKERQARQLALHAAQHNEAVNVTGIPTPAGLALWA